MGNGGDHKVDAVQLVKRRAGLEQVLLQGSHALEPVQGQMHKPSHGTTARRLRPAGARATRAATILNCDDSAFPTNADTATEAATTNVIAPTQVSLALLSVVLSKGTHSCDSEWGGARSGPGWFATN